MSGRGCPYFDPEYDTLLARLNPPSVVIDNTSCADATLVKVDSANRHGILLEVVQVLSDMDLIISKAYISSDGGWFMDVFHVTDQLGQKLTDEGIIDYIQQSLGAKQESLTTEVRTCLGRTVGLQSIAEHTAIELTGRDRPGLLSEVSGVLKDLMCNVVAAEVWTHNMRVACVVYVTDELTGGPVEDANKLTRIKEQLSQVLRNDNDGKSGKTDFSLGLTHTERRLHQMMFADRDYEGGDEFKERCIDEKGHHPIVTVHNCEEKGYSVVSLRCRDRPKLLFDTVCTLTDMQYVVFHASVDTDGTYAYQVTNINICFEISNFLVFLEATGNWDLVFTLDTTRRTSLDISLNFFCYLTRSIIYGTWMDAHSLANQKSKELSNAWRLLSKGGLQRA
ncbi:hypothetical protein O6H91_02G020700 [Diphasiastrum complanatum]|uniref:Uncharacterized protein n=1 Tax=Diphasiastrum complanatum TaxID=34168 RepID=A0ACC2EDD2_DIPCM|nr:hypothetical protein O6H91_02G020700 [Diphasiastrum complanatum]